MKKIIMILLALLLLCSCVKEPPAENPEENLSVSEEDIENFNSSKENIPAEEPKEETDPVEEASVAEVRGMWIGSERDRWKRDGFTATPGNVTIFEDGTFSYTFTAKTENTIFSFPAYGMLSYKDMDEFSRENQNEHILATWGTEGILENGIRYFITLGKVVFVDKDFKLVGQVLLPQNSYYHMWPMSVTYSEETGYIVPVSKIPKDGSKPADSGLIFTYDEDFKQISESGGIPVIYETFGKNHLPMFCSESYLYTLGEVLYLSTVMEYNLDDNSGYLLYNHDNKFYDGDRAVALVSGKQYDPKNPDVPTKNYAILYEGKNMIDYIALDEFYPFEAGLGGTPIAETSIFDGGMKAELFSEFYHRTILLNFKKKTVDVKYKFAEEDLAEAFDISSNEKYSLHAASADEGMISYSVVLKNNFTGSMKYMFTGGHLVSCGFLKNDDIYYQTNDSLRIYSSENGEVTFDISKKFPLNTTDPTKDYRSIVAFRRNPDDLSFMVVYWEGHANSIYSDDPGGLPVYNIGFFDESGNLLETYESKIPVALGMHSWPQDAVIYYKDGKYTVTTSGDKGDPGINFTFDHTVGEFSPAKKNRG